MPRDALSVSLLHERIRELPPGATIVDYGCFGWLVSRIAAEVHRPDIMVIGCDTAEPPDRPPGAAFVPVDAESDCVALPDDAGDMVVASHVIEHVRNPIRLVGELVRIAKPGGLLYIEAPSEKMALSASDPDVEGHGFESFWDDPTHIRPYPPAALYRLAISYGCTPLHCSYGGTVERWAAKGWISQLLAQKPQMSGKPPYGYISLADTPRGMDAALDQWRRTVAAQMKR
jgi:SAM-dependent methyltransferase